MKNKRRFVLVLGALTSSALSAGLFSIGCGSGGNSEGAAADAAGDGTVDGASDDGGGGDARPDSPSTNDGAADSTVDTGMSPESGEDGQSAVDSPSEATAIADGGDAAADGSFDAEAGNDSSSDAPAEAAEAPDAADASDAADADGGNTAAMLAFPGQVAAALCNRFLNCCQATSSTFDTNSCIAQYVGFGYAGSSEGTQYLGAGNVTFDPVQAQSCLNQINAIDCTADSRTSAQEKAIISACFGAFAGTLEAGAPCHDAIECAAGQFCVPTDGGATGTCGALRTNGQPCGDLAKLDGITTDTFNASELACSYRASGNTGVGCHYGDFVDAGSWICQTQVGVDAAACIENQDCQSMLCDPGANFNVYKCANAETFIYPQACQSFLVDAGGD